MWEKTHFGLQRSNSPRWGTCPIREKGVRWRKGRTEGKWHYRTPRRLLREELCNNERSNVSKSSLIRVENVDLPSNIKVFPLPRRPQIKDNSPLGNSTSMSCNSKLFGAARLDALEEDPFPFVATPFEATGSCWSARGQVTVASLKATSTCSMTGGSAKLPSKSSVTRGISTSGSKRYFSIRRRDTTHWRALTTTSGMMLRANRSLKVFECFQSVSLPSPLKAPLRPPTSITGTFIEGIGLTRSIQRDLRKQSKELGFSPSTVDSCMPRTTWGRIE